MTLTSSARQEPDARARREPAAKGAGWLVADVGGTNARFGWVDAAGGRAAVRDVRSLPVAAHASLADAAEAYLRARGEDGPTGAPRPRRAALACATTVGGDRVDFTNSAWTFSRAELQRALGLQQLLVLNDFEALALSLPRLGAGQLRAHAGWPEPRGTLAVVGPGTGLGVAGVVQTAAGWQALPGEGGHATLAATDDFEAAMLQFVRREHAHVSAERLLSGIGLPVLHRAVAAVLGHDAAKLEAPAIVERALAGDDASCARTLEAFCALLGSFCGNVALTLGARGGLAIGGGIVPRLGELFFASRFRERFEAKGRFRSYLELVPTAVITDTCAALAGAALALEQSAPA